MHVTLRVNLLLGCVLATCVGGCGKVGGGSAQDAGARQELRRGLGAEPETLDPHLAADNAALTVVNDLYEGLVTEAADGTLVPAAADHWSVSSDGLSWTFVLRPGLRWSNGDPLTAEQFATSLRAAIEPGTVLPNAGLLDKLRRVEVLAPDRLSIELAQPLPYLPALLALPISAPTHPGAAAAVPAPSNGPYRLVRWQRGERIELERNPRFRGATNVRIPRVTYRLVTDLVTELNLYRTGELDVTSEVPNDRLAWLRKNLGADLRIDPYLSTYAYAVNLNRLPDQAAREALAMAVDRERITSLVTGAGEQPAYEWVPPGLASYAPQSYAWRDWPAGRRLAAARERWHGAAKRKAAPTELTLCTDASANHHRTAVALADQWREALGIEVKLVELEWNVYLATRASPGDCDLVRLGWSADFADPEAFAAIFGSGHPQNTLGYASGAYDDLLARSRAATDPAERSRLLAEAERLMLADVPVIPVFHRVAKRLVKPQIRGYVPNPLGHLASRDLAIQP
jgi:oligopeptide transport system substrate-binding protein